MKGQTYGDGRKQREKAVPRDAIPPTVSTESVIIMVIIDAHGGCDVNICNITGDFTSADMDEDVKMELYGRLAERMINILPQIYRQHVIYEKGRMIIYITLKRFSTDARDWHCCFMKVLWQTREARGLKSAHMTHAWQIK